MALTALDTAHLSFCHFTTFSQQFVHSFHFFVVSVAFIIDLGTFVALYTPFHCQRRILIHFLHRLNRTVAGSTFNFSNSYVLRVVEVSEIGQVVNTYPLYRACQRAIVFLSLRIETNSCIDLIDLR